MPLACSLVRAGLRRSVLGILLSSGLCLCLHHYHFIDEPKTWSDAKKYCREKYTDLAKIENSEDMEQLIAAAGSGYKGNFWIGLHDRPWSWGWSSSESNKYKLEFKRWAEGEPDNRRGYGLLCVAVQQGFWYDHSCNNNFTFVCYNKHDIFIYINKTMTWQEAQLFCRTNHTDLARVHNDSENTELQQMVPPDQTAWIGLSRSTWAWWAGSPHKKYENWADGHPLNSTGNCATSVFNANHTGKWVEKKCKETSRFMCSNSKTQLFNVRLTALTSTVDLNYPAVTEAILDAIEEKMKENGIMRDFKMTWIKKPNADIFHKEEKDADVLNTDF